MGDRLTLLRDGELEGGAIARFVATPCHFGGQRWWFECPACGTRAAHLYLRRARLECRRCADLTYYSQRETLDDRMLRRTRKIRGRVGGSRNLIEPFPGKPRGMHWRTYHRLRRQEAVAHLASLRGAIAVLQRMRV